MTCTESITTAINLEPTDEGSVSTCTCGKVNQRVDSDVRVSVTYTPHVARHMAIAFAVWFKNFAEVKDGCEHEWTGEFRGWHRHHAVGSGA